jgi:hypothetical protein
VTENDYALSVPEEATRRRRVVSKEASEGGESFGRVIRKKREVFRQLQR